MPPPLVSVIVPAYNAEPYLRRALDSLTKQTLTDWEAVCIDDGSADATGAILDEYAARDARFLVRHTANGGAARARNLALQVVRGEFITMLDADDWLDTTTLEKLCAPLREAPQATLSVVDFTRHAGDGNTHIWEHRRHGKPLRGVQPADDYNLSSLLVCSCGKMYRRDIITRHALHYREGQQVGEDACFVMCYLAHAENIAFVPEGLYHYADSATSVVNAYYAGTVPLQTYQDNLSAPLRGCEYAETIVFSSSERQRHYYTYLLNRTMRAYAECGYTGIRHHPEYRKPLSAIYRTICARLYSHLPLTSRFCRPLCYWCGYWATHLCNSIRFRANRIWLQCRADRS